MQRPYDGHRHWHRQTSECASDREQRQSLVLCALMRRIFSGRQVCPVRAAAAAATTVVVQCNRFISVVERESDEREDHNLILVQFF